MCIKTYLNHPVHQKRREEKNLRAITVFQKRGGGEGPARYDHNHRFNRFFCFETFPKIRINTLKKTLRHILAVGMAVTNDF